MNIKTFMSSCALGALVLTATVHAQNWPAWRGDAAGSGATDQNLPLKWGPDHNVRWRVDLPERGNSTPVVHGDRVFVTQPIEDEDFRGLYCFDRNTGKQLWKQGVTYPKPERTHKANPYASGSPATDGQRVYVGFGSAGLHCYDMQGNEVWSRDFGPIDHTWGNSSSPVLVGDLCIYYHGPGEGARLVALDKKTGKTVWQFEEPEWNTQGRTDGFRGREGDGVVGSFSTPIIINTADRSELVMSFPNRIIAFNPATGEQFWHCDGLNPLVYTSPVYGDGVIVTMGGYHGNTLAVQPGGSGDVTDSRRLWHKVRDNGGIGSGVIQDGYLYYHNSGGIVFCLDAKTGDEQWKARIPGIGKSWGSFLLADDRIYTLGQTGNTVVFEANPEKFNVMAENNLDEMTNSSPVPAHGDLIIRTHEALWCISAPKVN